MTAALIDSLFLQEKKVIHLLFKTLRFHGASAAFPGRFRGNSLPPPAVRSPRRCRCLISAAPFSTATGVGGLSVVVAVSWGGQRPSPAQPLRAFFWRSRGRTRQWPRHMRSLAQYSVNSAARTHAQQQPSWKSVRL